MSHLSAVTDVKSYKETTTVYLALSCQSVFIQQMNWTDENGDDGVFFGENPSSVLLIINSIKHNIKWKTQTIKYFYEVIQSKPMKI